MGFFDKFTKSFEDKVNEALDQIRGMGLGVTGLGAMVEGKVVKLTGEAADMQAKAKVMEVFNRLVDTENTFNMLTIPAPEPAAPVAEEVVDAPTEQLYEVVSGDTLGGISKKFYGNAGKYMKIFEANRDILDDPNLIKVGQKLRIPE
ncbi:MAG: LysM peptidoglycan-binding domain-containing protein [Thermoanaerobaculales bacterium]|nr:LysM peptidoglycan-binding domain-containing protein [Thermoanaerobaculales bacterium]